MASLAPKSHSWRFVVEPMRGAPLVACGLIIWLAGAAYCMGYEQLRSGLGQWPGSLTWSAIAVAPWFALFEWAKQPRHRETAGRPAMLVALVVGVAVASITLEFIVDYCLGNTTDRIGLLLLRRLPAIGATMLLIALARKTAVEARQEPVTTNLSNIADVIDWVAAADNYVELHILGNASLRRMTLAEAQRALAAHGFVRIHRRYLVNRARITSVGEKSVRLHGGTELPVGTAFAANLRGLV